MQIQSIIIALSCAHTIIMQMKTLGTVFLPVIVINLRILLTENAKFHVQLPPTLMHSLPLKINVFSIVLILTSVKIKHGPAQIVVRPWIQAKNFINMNLLGNVFFPVQHLTMLMMAIKLAFRDVLMENMPKMKQELAIQDAQEITLQIHQPIDVCSCVLRLPNYMVTTMYARSLAKMDSIKIIQLVYVLINAPSNLCYLVMIVLTLVLKNVLMIQIILLIIRLRLASHYVQMEPLQRELPGLASSTAQMILIHTLMKIRLKLSEIANHFAQIHFLPLISPNSVSSSAQIHLTKLMLILMILKSTIENV